MVFDYVCPACGKTFSEFVRGREDKVFCPACGRPAERLWNGKMYSSTGAKGGACTGDCKTCGGCAGRGGGAR